MRFKIKIYNKHTIVFDIENVMPAWLGATSAWLLKCPAELQAQRPMDIEINLLSDIYFN